MLVNPRIFIDQWTHVLALTLLVVVGKWAINMAIGFVFCLQAFAQR